MQDGSAWGYHLFDGNKNITSLRAEDGTVLAEYHYGPFGQTLSATGPWADTNPFRFSSEYHDAETSLVYYNYRHYSPTLGKWLNRDPIEEQGGVNLYAMVNNNPIKWWDDFGEKGNGLPWSKAPQVGLIPSGADLQGVQPTRPRDDLTSVSFDLTIFFFNHSFSQDGNGCWTYCLSWTTTLAGASIGMGAKWAPDYSIPVSVSVGISEHLSVSSDVGSGSINMGVGWPPTPVNVSIKFTCMRLSVTDTHGCPCPDVNIDNSTIHGILKQHGYL